MEILAGTILNYYREIGVARVKILDFLEVGDRIHIKGHTTDFEQEVESLQVGHVQVSASRSGEIAGLRVYEYVRKHDRVYRVED